MQRFISVIERKANGTIAVVSNREEIDCDDDFGGVNAVIDNRRRLGADMVLVLDATDAVLRHWTKPAA